MAKRSASEMEQLARGVLAMISDAAAAGRPAPTNDQICTVLGIGHVATASKLVERLEAAGLIRVQRFPRARVIELVATGQRTAPQVGSTLASGREDELAQLVSEGATIEQAAQTMGIGKSTAWGLWVNIRSKYGWQAK